MENVQLLGNINLPKVAIFSFIIHAPKGKRFLHHNFVAKLLNDLFGIQSRSGCSCAGIYPYYLLGIKENIK